MATSLRPRKPRPPGLSSGPSTTRSGRVPSGALPGSSSRQHQVTPKPALATLEEAESGSNPSEPQAGPQAQPAKEPKEDALSLPNAEQAPEPEAAVGKMANPFAAQASQKPKDPRGAGSGNEAESGAADSAATAQPQTEAEQSGHSQIGDLLDPGAAVISDSHHSPESQAERLGQQHEEGPKPASVVSPRHPPVSAFTALASKPEQ